MKVNIEKNTIPTEGLTISASPGNKFTRVHLDMASDGISLAMVGAASALREEGSRHSVTLSPSEDGITLAMVGAAAAPTE